jgi:hypothetical protein
MKRELTNHLSAHFQRGYATDGAIMQRQIAIDKLLDSLKDGRWHSAEEVQQASGLDARRTKLILSFMNEFNLIQTDKKTNKIRLSRLTKQFLEKLNETDPKKSYEEITA